MVRGQAGQSRGENGVTSSNSDWEDYVKIDQDGRRQRWSVTKYIYISKTGPKLKEKIVYVFKLL